MKTNILNRKTSVFKALAFAIVLSFVFLPSEIHAQRMDTYYQQLPEPPSTADNISILKRQLQGLGFRYYWSTEGLTPEDLNFRITKEARSSRETLEHIYNLCITIQNTVKNVDSNRLTDVEDVSWETLRAATLASVKAAEAHLDTTSVETLQKQNVIFASGRKTDFSFLYLINGPLSDALTHVGQILMLRRASGNPQLKGVNVFTGIKQQD